MSLPIPERFRKGVESLPAVLRSLLDAELESGNRIMKVEHGHPAQGDGVCVMLAKPVTTRARANGDGLTFRKVSSSLYSASFTDSDADHFILEAPLEEDGAYPDMNAIREAANHPRAVPVAAKDEPKNLTPIDKFRASMKVDYEMWHDGVGYKVELLAEVTDADRAQILSMLVPPSGWRDVEALAALDTDGARTALRKALKSGNAEVRAAVLRYAPTIATDAERLETILHALKHGKFFDDLTSVLDQVEEFHPPEVINALFRGLFVRPGEIATNYAGMLTFLHGKADSTFDWDQRPLFLKFNSDDGAERTRAFEELCVLLELDPAEVMARIKE